LYIDYIKIRLSDPVDSDTCTTLVVAEPLIVGIPSETVLSVADIIGVVPNPFNPRTTITYSLRETGSVRLSIYDVQGRLIKTLVNDEQEAGEHQAIWNGRDGNGVKAGSGVYFVKLISAGQSQTRKIVMLK
jgi:hypothetical protein